MTLNSNGKWSKAFWVDLGERTAASAIGGALTLIPLDQLVNLDAGIAWTVVGVPTATSLLKGLLANLKTGDPTAPSASLAPVDSLG